jgi:hypothetical protein
MNKKMNKIFRMTIRSDKSLRISSKGNIEGLLKKGLKKIFQGVKKQPERFNFKNRGLRNVATENIRNYNQITLIFKDGEGIFNGCHSYNVLKNFSTAVIPNPKLKDVSESNTKIYNIGVNKNGENIR